MQNVSATVEIEAPADKVWAVLADFGNIEAFNPGLTASYITGDSPRGVGATRHCDLSFAGASIEERIVDWQEGSSYTVEIYDGTRTPFAEAFATMSVAEVDPNRSLASMRLEWKAKGGLFAGLLGRGMRGQNVKAVSGVLAGLKHHVETGRRVDAGQRVDRSPVTAR